MDFAVFGWGFTAVAYTALALSLRRAGRLFTDQPGVHRVFVLAVVGSAAWAATGWLALAAHSLAASAANAVFDTLRTALLLAYLVRLLHPPGEGSTGSHGLMPAAWLLPIGGWLTNMLAVVAPHLLGDTGRTAFLVQLAAPVFGLLLLEQFFRRTPREFHWNIKPLCLGLGCIFLYDVYLYSLAMLFGVLDGASVEARGPVHALAVPLLFLATRRHADWRASAQVSRVVVFHTATLMGVGAYLLLIAAAGYYVQHFGGDWGRALQLATVAGALLALAVVALSGTVRARVRVFIAKNFFAYRYDYRAEWLRFTARLSGEAAPQAMGERIVQGLAEMLQCPGGALWAAPAGGAEHTLVGRWNLPPITAREPVDSSLCRFLAATGWIVDLDEYRRDPARYAALDAPAWLLAQADFWLVVPLFVGPDQLLGFVVLRRAPNATEMSWEVRDLLKTASRQGASFLAQARATEALLEAQKFDAFHRMSAFVVHDLKNIITQLSLMMQNAKRLRDNPEFQQDMLLTVESSVEKMQTLMQQLREGDKPLGVVHGVEMAGVAEQARAMASARGRRVEVVADAGPLLVRGQPERLARVIGHLVQNALEATPPEGEVVLRLARDGACARVEVADTGHGMSPEFIANRLFKPFSTTKSAGMGIGAYESFQYVKELGGRIDVESEQGRGTTIRLWLPLQDAKMPAADDAEVTSAP